MIKKYSSCLVFLMFIQFSCNESRGFLTDTPTSGKITVVADETYRPVLDSEKMVFESHYPEAKINIVYKPAVEVFKAMDDDSVRMVITAMPVDSSYIHTFYQNRKYYPTSSFLAKDAVAVIANNARKGMKITLEELSKICSGQITDFSQLENGFGSGKIALVFDNPASSTLQYIQDSLLNGGAITQTAFAQKTNEDVKSYVKDNKNAIGIIGVNWISDNLDEDNLAFSKDIFPVEVRDSKNSQHYYPPHPGYIASHLYPMRRLMRATLKENGAALGRGFLNFMTSEVGQRIVLKAGLVPANVITRVVDTNPQ